MLIIIMNEAPFFTYLLLDGDFRAFDRVRRIVAFKLRTVYTDLCFALNDVYNKSFDILRNIEIRVTVMQIFGIV